MLAEKEEGRERGKRKDTYVRGDREREKKCHGF